MDLRHDNVTLADTGLPGGGAVDTIASGVKNLAASIRNKAKAKKAQAISDAGGYATLTPFQKSLIQIPAYAVAAGLTAQEAKDAPAVGVTAGQLKKYLPYVAGIILVGIIIYFIVKRKK